MPNVCDRDLNLSRDCRRRSGVSASKAVLTFALVRVNWPLGKIGKPMGFAFDALAETVTGTAQFGSPARAWQFRRAPFGGHNPVRGV